MSKLRFYEYKACSTCQKASKFLDREGVEYQRLPIVDQPPTLAELQRMLGFVRESGGDFKSLFNTSGVMYRELGIAAQLKAGMTEKEALELLAKNGKLIKRPFLLGPDFGLVGFREEAWKSRANRQTGKQANGGTNGRTD